MLKERTKAQLKPSLRWLIVEDKKINWERFIARGGHPIFMLDSIQRTNAKFLKKILGIPNLTYWKRDSEASFFKSEELKAIRDKIEKEFNKNPQWVTQRIKKMSNLLAELLVWSKNMYVKDYGNMSRGQLFKLLKTVLSKTDELWVSAYFPMIADQAISACFAIKTNIPHSLLEKMTIPARLTTLQNKNNELFLLKRKYGLTPPARVIKDFIKRYEWSRSYVMLIKPYSRSEFLQDLKASQKTVVNQVIKVPLRLASCGTRIDCARKLVEFRDERMMSLTKVYFYLKPFFEALAKSFHLRYEDFTQLHISEIFANKYRKSDILARKRGYTYLVFNGWPYAITGRARKYFTNDAVKHDGKLEGKPAFPGRVRGPVKLANPYTYQDIKRGDVVVIGMTTPEVVPYLKGVAAIVTDEGGLTSHVAIVAREFKIPCVMGTKIATSIYKTGDTVEVDANKGIVRKL